jgi:hypothetical protein
MMNEGCLPAEASAKAGWMMDEEACYTEMPFICWRVQYLYVVMI